LAKAMAVCAAAFRATIARCEEAFSQSTILAEVVD
jgi:hypothetical protein